MLNLNEVSNRSSSIEQAIQTVASLDYHALSVLDESSLDQSDLEKEVQTDSSLSSEDFSIEYALMQDSLTSSYDISKEYGPTFRTATADPSDLYEEVVSTSTSEVRSEMMTAQEYADALQDIQYAAVVGAWSDITYGERVRMNNFFTYDTVLARITHDLNCITRDVNFRVI